MALQPEISIIIISFNTREILRNCLNSIYLNCKELSPEIIVVDNHSNDNTVDMLYNDFPQITVIANSENRGFAAANNQAMEIASGKFLLLLNSDTIILGDVIEKSLSYMKNNPQMGAMGCRVLNPDKSLQLTCFRWPSIPVLLITASGLGQLPIPGLKNYERMGNWQRDNAREVDAITGCFLLVSRQAYNETGNLDENFFFYGEETDWCRRIRQHGYKVKLIPVGEIIHLGGASGESASPQRRRMLLNAILRLHLKHHGKASMFMAGGILFINELIRGSIFRLLSFLNKNKYRLKSDKHLTVCQTFNSVWPNWRKYD